MLDFIEEILHFQCGHAYSLPLNIEAPTARWGWSCARCPESYAKAA